MKTYAQEQLDELKEQIVAQIIEVIEDSLHQAHQQIVDQIPDEEQQNAAIEAIEQALLEEGVAASLAGATTII